MGYSNFTFDLWIALHKSECCSPIAHRSKYLKPINIAFGKDFQYIKDYKKEDNFKAILACIEIADVISAISNAEKIRKKNKDSGKQLLEYKKFKYYRDNPDLTIQAEVRKILKECKII